MIHKPVYQLELELNLPEVEEEGAGVSAQEVALRQETARSLFEASNQKPDWYHNYEELIRGKWPFRVAMYIAWAASPRKGREPDTLHGLASLMGLKSPRAIHTWRANNPVIDQQVSLMQAAPLFQHRADLFQAALDVALNNDYKGHNDRKMLFEMLGDYVRRSEVKGLGTPKDLKEMSDAELRAWAGSLASEDDEDANDSHDDD